MDIINDRASEERYASTLIECKFCENMFLDNEIHTSHYDESLNFCSEYCVKEFDKENGWEFEEELNHKEKGEEE